MNSPEERWKALYRYWLSKHVNGQPPSRGDLDPVIEIPRLIANLMILDVGPGGYKYRVVGSEIVNRVGMDVTGRSIGSSFSNGAAIGLWRDALDGVVVDRKPRLIFSRIFDAPTAKNVVIILPLVSVGGKVEKILAGSFYNEYFMPGSRIEGIIVQEVDYRGVV
jgi:hypothetical protein